MEQWNHVIDEIERHLDGHIDVPALAELTSTTEFHFRRIFSTLTGMPISEYVRRRRMSVAAAAILRGSETVETIAQRYGYTSPDSFTRAFRTVHDLTPEQARLPGARLRSQSRLRFHLRVDGRYPISYRIVPKNRFRLVGRCARVPLTHQGISPAMAAFQETISETDYLTIEGLSDQEPRGVLTVCNNIAKGRGEGSSMDYLVAAATNHEPPVDYHVVDVPACTWLVLNATGTFPTTIENMWYQAGAEWFPSNPYQPAPGPEIVRATHDRSGSQVEVELWLPIQQ